MFVRIAQETSWNLRWAVLDSPLQGGQLQLYKTWHSTSSPVTSIECALLRVRPQSEEQKQVRTLLVTR